MYRENPERDFEVVRAVAAAIIGQLDTLSPYILLVLVTAIKHRRLLYWILLVPANYQHK